MQNYAAQWLRVCEEAAAREDFDAAKVASERALAAAGESKDKSLVELMQQRTEAIRLAREATHTFNEAVKVLAQRPDDPQANLRIGLYLCSRRGNWAEALTALAKASDQVTREAAQKDVAAAKAEATAGERINVGDLWLGLAKTQPREDATVREAFRQRARFWYETALPLLDEADKPALLKRMDGLPAAIDFTAVTKAAAAGTARTAAAGDAGGGEFEEAPDPAVLIGFHATTHSYKGYDIIASLQPVFATPAGRTSGMVSGTPRGAAKPVIAKEGYAVGGMVVASGERMHGFEVVFMRIKGNALDPADSYTSPWLGSQGGDRTTIGTNGKLAVGVHGRRGADFDAVGLIHLK
jgi:hypothetical protein